MRSSRKKVSLLTALGVAAAAFIFHAVSFAETPVSSDVTAPVLADVPALEKKEALAVPPLSSSSNVTVDFKDADIQNVLRVISFKSGVNIVAGNDVVGTVTIRLVDVPWEKALDVVLKTYGYAYDRDENIVRVTTLENLKKGELSTEVFTLNYSQSAEVEKALKDMLSERGRIRSDARSNTVIVTDMPTILQSVSRVVERLDHSTPQVLIQAKIIELTLGDADKLGIKWNVDASITGAKRPSTVPFSNSNEESKPYRSFIPQGNIPAATFPTADYTHQATFPFVDKTDFTFGSLNFSQFQAALQLIQSRKDSRTLSEPHIVTLNNKPAKILVGDVISIPLFERNVTTGKMEITGYTNRDVGIRLEVTPSVNDQNEIVVIVHPEVTTLVGYDTITADIKAPHFTTREAHTEVRIKSGQTIAIGGLIKEEKITTNTKVPFLGDAPLIGKLFRHFDTTVNKTDLLFFVTVDVVSEDVLPAGHPAAK